MRLSAEVRGLDGLFNKLDKIESAHKQKKFERGMAEGAAVVVNAARKLVPVRTRRLRDSLHVGGYTKLTAGYRRTARFGALRPPEGRGRELSVFLGSTLPYAHLVERGTQKTQAKPYMRRAIDEQQREILRKIDGAVQEMIDEA